MWLRSNKVDFVHTYNAMASSWGSMAAQIAGTRTLVGGEHGTIWSVRPPYSWLNRWAYQRARLIVANSEASRLLINHRFRIPLAKIKVVHNAVPSYGEQVLSREPIVKHHASRAPLVVGSVGRLTAQKNFAVLVEAAALTMKRNQNIIFLLVGGGEEEDVLRRRVRELGLEKNFLMTGWRSDARELIRQFDIFVSTSLYEPFGNVLVEAALAGKPTIAPAVDGIPEAVADGETGLLISPSLPVPQTIIEKTALPRQVVIDGQLHSPRSLNPAILADAILALAENPVQRAEFGSRGLQRATELFGIDRYINELEATYTSIL